MKEYPVGTICVIVNLVVNKEYNGKEVTILSPIEGYVEYITGEMQKGYQVDMEYEGCQVYIDHEHLRPKKFPPDAAFDAFMTKVKSTVDVRETQEV